VERKRVKRERRRIAAGKNDSIWYSVYTVISVNRITYIRLVVEM